MIWVISALLCLGLVVAIIGVLYPEIVLPFLAKLWDKQSYYWK